MFSARDLRFRWQPGAPLVLDIPIFDLHPAERVFLAGPSGTGKTSLLSVLSGIAPATAGSARLLGQELVGLSGAARDRLRAEQLGIIFQLFNLVPYLSALENVMLGCQFSAPRRAAVAAGGETVLQAARRLLTRLGLPESVVGQRAAVELSVGQQQRVAAARALIGRPALVVADEPTSALDSALRDEFLGLLLQECAAAGSALLLVSHDWAMAPQFDRVVELSAINRACAPPPAPVAPA